MRPLTPLKKNGMEIAVFADSHWAMLLKALGQTLGTVEGYRKTAGKCPEAVG